MGKVIVLISTTPDGFAESQDVIIDPEFFELTHALMAVSGAVLFGRTTFELFQERWPGRMYDINAPEFVKKMALALNDIHKIVVSSSLKTTTWYKSEIVPNIDADNLNSYRQSDMGGLVIFGSLSLIESLTEMNLIDDYYFNIQPLIAGRGEARFFKKVNLAMPHPLQYVEHIPMKSGALVIHYQNSHSNF